MASAARLATAVRDAGSLDEAQAVLDGLGVRTELAWERNAAAAAFLPLEDRTALDGMITDGFEGMHA